MVSVAREEGTIDDIRAILGNDITIGAYREKTLPFPDGAIIARLSWTYEASEENNEIFGQTQSHIEGPPKNGLHFMSKDSKKYASTGDWEFVQFDDGQPLTDAAKISACFTCHALLPQRDLVFTRCAL